MTDNNSKFLFCVTFDEKTRQELIVKGIDMRSSFCAKQTSSLPYHLTLAPPFSIAKDRRLKMLDAADKVLASYPRPYIFTTACDIFDADANGLAQLVILAKKTQQLLSLHTSLLPVLETYRDGGNNETTLMQRRFGSDFVMERYNPHITLGTITPDKLTDKTRERAQGDFNRSYRDTKITVFEKTDKWASLMTYPRY